jgi:hypothetical protein
MGKTRDTHRSHGYMRLPRCLIARSSGDGWGQVQSGCSGKSRCGEGRRVEREVATTWLVHLGLPIRQTACFSPTRLASAVAPNFW